MLPRRGVCVGGVLPGRSVCVWAGAPSLALPSEGLGPGVPVQGTREAPHDGLSMPASLSLRPVSWKAALQRAWRAPVAVVGAGRMFCSCLCTPGGETRPPALPGMGWG